DEPRLTAVVADPARAALPVLRRQPIRPNVRGFDQVVVDGDHPLVVRDHDAPPDRILQRRSTLQRSYTIAGMSSSLPWAASSTAVTSAARPAMTDPARNPTEQPASQLARSQHARRERILAAVLELAREGGYDAVQVREVAARAHVALRTIYNYY